MGSQVHDWNKESTASADRVTSQSNEWAELIT